MGKKILCIGDSITDGRPGVSYIKYLKCKKQCYNFGLGGDTLIGMTSRLQKIIRKPKYAEVSDIVIGIGANDVLTLFLNNYSKLWKLRNKSLIKRGSIPCVDERQFEEEYIKLLELVKSLNKNIIVFSIPYMETSYKEINEKTALYNDIIKRLCRDSDIPYVDFRSWQEKAKKEAFKQGTCFMSRNPLMVGVDAVLTSYLSLTNYISNKRNLTLTVDGCHLNHFSAKALAEIIEKNLGNKER